MMTAGRLRYLCFAMLALGSLASGRPCAAQDNGKFGLLALPNVFYLPETGFGMGFMGIMTMARPAAEKGFSPIDSLKAGGAYTQNGQASGWISMEANLGGSGTKLGLDASMSRFPSRYFGIGPYASADEAYVPFMGSVDARLSFRLSPGFYASPRLKFSASKTLERESGGLLADAGLAGGDGYISSGLGFGLTYDKRDFPMTPTEGGYVDLGLLFSPRLLGSSQEYGLACLDARTYLVLHPTWRPVLALQVRIEAAFGNPPFQELPRFGGDKLMRGFHDGRYRDACSVVFQTELRLPVWWRLGLTVFGGLAQVASSVSGLDSAHPKVAGGVGIRFRMDDASRANLRLDVAWAGNGPQFYFNFGEAF